MKALTLAHTLELPADEAATQKYGFIGRSGSGKSYAAMKLAELFLGRRRSNHRPAAASRPVRNSSRENALWQVFVEERQ